MLFSKIGFVNLNRFIQLVNISERWSYFGFESESVSLKFSNIAIHFAVNVITQISSIWTSTSKCICNSNKFTKPHPTICLQNSSETTMRKKEEDCKIWSIPPLVKILAVLFSKVAHRYSEESSRGTNSTFRNPSVVRTYPDQQQRLWKIIR